MFVELLEIFLYDFVAVELKILDRKEAQINFQKDMTNKHHASS